MTARRRPFRPASPRDLAPGIALMLACVRALPAEGRRADDAARGGLADAVAALPADAAGPVRALADVAAAWVAGAVPDAALAAAVAVFNGPLCVSTVLRRRPEPGPRFHLRCNGAATTHAARIAAAMED